MRLLQLIQENGDYFGLFTYNQDKDPTDLIQRCLSRAETLYENDFEDEQELEEYFIDALEEEGIVRVYTEEFNINI